MPSACVRPNIPYIPAALRAVVPDAKPTAQEACSVRYLVDQASPMKGGTLPTRGVSSYRKLRKPGAGARVARFCPFSCFHCGAALWENHPRRTAPLPLAKKRFVEFGGYRKTVPLHRPRSGSAPPRTSPASPGRRAFFGFGGYRRVARWERALGESSAPHGSTSPGGRAFRQIQRMLKRRELGTVRAA